VPKARSIRLALLGVVAAHVALALAWIGYQELPQGGRDEFFIVEVATELAYRLREGAGWSGLRGFISDAYYPPLTRFPGVVALLAGGGYDSMLVAQWVVWLPLLVGGTFVVGRKLGGDRAGLIAVAVLLAGPAIADGLHRYEPNLGATAAASCVLAAWLYCGHFSDRRASLLFGLFLGLGLMSDRLGVLPFVGLPILWSIVAVRGRGCWRGLGLAALAVVVTCGWWYADFFGRFAQELIPQLLGGELGVGGEVLIEDRTPPLWFWLHYLVLWPDTQLGLVGGLLGLAALVWAAGRVDRPEVRLALVFLGGGLLLFTLVPKRQAYYTMPLLPAVAALVGAMLSELAGRGRVALTGVVALVAVASVPTALNVRPGLVDLNRGMASWLLLGQSPIQEWLLVQRYPVGGPPQDLDLDVSALVSTLRSAGLSDDTPIAALSLDSQVSESFLVSLLRIERHNHRTHGVTRHQEEFVRGIPAAGALVVAHRDGDGWPESGAIVDVFANYYGWDEVYRPVLDRMAALQPLAVQLDQRPLGEEDTLTVWRLGPSPAAAAPQVE